MIPNSSNIEMCIIGEITFMDKLVSILTEFFSMLTLTFIIHYIYAYI